jgi:hypothetical protein
MIFSTNSGTVCENLVYMTIGNTAVNSNPESFNKRKKTQMVVIKIKLSVKL